MGAALFLSVALFIGILAHNIDTWSRVDVGITAYAQSELPPGKQFVLEGPDPRYPGGDPSWPAYARTLTKALEAKGFVPVASSPDLIIRVSYRVGDTQTSVSTDPARSRNDTTNTTVTTTNLRTIQLEALDAASSAAGKPTVVWSIRAQTRSTGDSMATVFPNMVAAIEDYVGTNAEQEVKVSKYFSDPEVARLTQP